jgi:hypothetical protein
MQIRAADVGPIIDLSFVLKALGYGAMGVAAIVLCLSYLLVRQLAAADPPRPPNDGAWQLVQKYMRFALVCTGAMVVLQVVDQAMKIFMDRKVAQLESRVLNARNFEGITEWHWQWGQGGWDTKGTFIKENEQYRFSATTMFKGCGTEARIMEWESTQPFTVADDDSDIVFLGVRKIVASDELLAKLDLGLTKMEIPTRFAFKRSWALTGKYSGPHGEGPFGDIMFYSPRK